MLPEIAHTLPEGAHLSPETAHTPPEPAGAHPETAHAHPETARAHSEPAGAHPKTAHAHPETAHAHPKAAGAEPETGRDLWEPMDGDLETALGEGGRVGEGAARAGERRTLAGRPAGGCGVRTLIGISLYMPIEPYIRYSMIFYYESCVHTCKAEEGWGKTGLHPYSKGVRP